MSKEITITLPDGSQKQAPIGVSGHEIASMIGAGLAKAAIAFSVDGNQRDLNRPPGIPYKLITEYRMWDDLDKFIH